MKLPSGPTANRNWPGPTSPDIAPRSAVNRLRAWIDRCQPLSQALHEAGYRKTSKWFTPHEVRLIVHYLGDP